MATPTTQGALDLGQLMGVVALRDQAAFKLLYDAAVRCLPAIVVRQCLIDAGALNVEVLKRLGIDVNRIDKCCPPEAPEGGRPKGRRRA